MAHEELKALYKIDKQHSDTPWEFWESYELGKWVDRRTHPMWLEECEYRRKPDAPVWDDDEKEDVRRKVRSIIESKDFKKAIEDMFSSDEFKNLLSFEQSLDYAPPQPKLIQGYTREQWQRIIDERFLCEFSDAEGFGYTPLIQTLREIDPFRSGSCSTWPYCRPLRIKGVRQPWFGGECPVDDDALVLARHLDDSSTWYKGTAKNVLWGSTLEFIEL